MPIHEKIIKVMRRISSVPKETEVVFRGGKYTAVSHNTLARFLHPILAEEGIYIRVSLLDSNTEWRNESLVFYTATYLVELTDETGDSVQYRVEAHALDNGDKTPGKAISYAVKTALLKAFLLEGAEEDEARVEIPTQIPPPSPKITQEQILELRRLISATETDPAKLLEYCGVKSLEDLTETQYLRVVEILEKKLAKRGGK